MFINWGAIGGAIENSLRDLFGDDGDDKNTSGGDKDQKNGECEKDGGPTDPDDPFDKARNRSRGFRKDFNILSILGGETGPLSPSSDQGFDTADNYINTMEEYDSDTECQWGDSYGVGNQGKQGETLDEWLNIHGY